MPQGLHEVVVGSPLIGLPIGMLSPIMENRMEKNIEHEMEARMIKGLIIFGSFPT